MAAVVIVDDSPQIRRLLRVMLESRGHLVREAEDGLVGWHLLQAEPPDLILLDLGMPGPSGFAVLREIRADVRFATLPVIVLTADGKLESEERARDEGASGFMVKPFSPIALTIMIDRLLQPS